MRGLYAVLLWFMDGSLEIPYVLIEVITRKRKQKRTGLGLYMVLEHCYSTSSLEPPSPPKLLLKVMLDKNE